MAVGYGSPQRRKYSTVDIILRYVAGGREYGNIICIVAMTCLCTAFVAEKSSLYVGVHLNDCNNNNGQ